jgi:hypothetical protein
MIETLIINLVFKVCAFDITFIHFFFYEIVYPRSMLIKNLSVLKCRIGNSQDSNNGIQNDNY